MPRFVDPFEEIDRVLSGFTGVVRAGTMPMDVYEKDGIYTLRFDLAGAEPNGVDVTVENGVLTVTANRAVEDTEGANWLVRERPTGTHSRQIRLGSRLDPDGINADYERGVLTVTIPIRPDAQPRKIEVGTKREAIAGKSASK